jgi:hypothetical protein
MIGIKQKLNRLLQKEGLNDSDIYYAEFDDFEEIPIFSRWDRISFLDSFSFDHKNKILLKTAIDLVESIIAKSKNRPHLDIENYLACVTITGWDFIGDINCITPNIFITQRRLWILDNLNLIIKGEGNELLVQGYLWELGLSQYKAFSPSKGNSERIFVVKQA